MTSCSDDAGQAVGDLFLKEGYPQHGKAQASAGDGNPEAALHPAPDRLEPIEQRQNTTPDEESQNEQVIEKIAKGIMEIRFTLNIDLRQCIRRRKAQ